MKWSVSCQINRIVIGFKGVYNISNSTRGYDYSNSHFWNCKYISKTPNYLHNTYFKSHERFYHILDLHYLPLLKFWSWPFWSGMLNSNQLFQYPWTKGDLFIQILSNYALIYRWKVDDYLWHTDLKANKLNKKHPQIY